MKKKMTALFAAMLLLAGTTFATGRTEPSAQLQNEFNRLFAQATEVTWQDVSGFHKVSFQQDGQYLTAFFNPAGGIESVSRNISTNALPLLLQKGLHEKPANTWVSESFELLGENGTEYYVTLENADSATVYQARGTDWVAYKKTKK